MAGPSDPQPILLQGLAALQAGNHQRAAELLRAVQHAVPETEFPWLALGNAEMALGNLDAAEAAIGQQLQLASRDVAGLLLMALLRERQADTRAASSFYRAAINQASLGGQVPPSLAELLAHGRKFVALAQSDYAGHLIEAIGEDLSPTMRSAVDLLMGRSEIYLQQPSLFYYPGLPQKQFYDAAQFPWLEGMLALLPAMKEEWAAGHEAGFAPYVTARPDRPAPNNPLLGRMDWSALYFWRDGARVEANAAACPATMAALDLAPMPRILDRAPSALWSRLLPGAHIAPHHGMLNTRLICHIPIRNAANCTLRVGCETRAWTEGEALVFDDSIEHEARNAGAEERVILLFEIWRPEVPEEDREAIGRIFRAIDTFGVD